VFRAVIAATGNQARAVRIERIDLLVDLMFCVRVEHFLDAAKWFAPLIARIFLSLVTHEMLPAAVEIFAIVIWRRHSRCALSFA
jgi:hypothetical protein